MIEPNSIQNLVYEYLGNISEAEKSELLEFILYRTGELLDDQLLEEQLQKLTEQHKIKIKGNIIYVIGEIDTIDSIDIAHYGNWNYIISFHVKLPQQRTIHLESIKNYIDRHPSLKDNNSFLNIKEITFDEKANPPKLSYEFRGYEWKGIINLFNNDVEIETSWLKREDFPELIEFLYTEHSNEYAKKKTIIPAMSHAFFLYYTFKSIIIDIHKESQFKIVRAESIKAIRHSMT